MTDVLGICLSWSEETVLVERADGERVEVPVADIVTGKPVPPRPNVRLRVSARDAELHTARLVAGVVSEPLGDWQLNHEPSPVGRIRGRFNSCLAMGDPGMQVTEALARVVAHYAALGRTPQLRLEPGSDVEAAVVAAGWEPIPEKDSVFLVASLAQLRRRLADTSPDSTGFTPDSTGERVRVSLAGGAAVVEGGLDGDWLGIHGLYVDPEHRREGLARRVMAELLEWGAERGARTGWLHVEVDNAPAVALYDSLGFAEHHQCRYYAAG